MHRRGSGLVLTVILAGHLAYKYLSPLHSCGLFVQESTSTSGIYSFVHNAYSRVLSSFLALRPHPFPLPSSLFSIFSHLYNNDPRVRLHNNSPDNPAHNRHTHSEHQRLAAIRREERARAAGGGGRGPGAGLRGCTGDVGGGVGGGEGRGGGGGGGGREGD
jgi:hypothetical protein